MRKKAQVTAHSGGPKRTDPNALDGSKRAHNPKVGIHSYERILLTQSWQDQDSAMPTLTARLHRLSPSLRSLTRLSYTLRIYGSGDREVPVSRMYRDRTPGESNPALC
jgi:hypothetical protein